MSPADAYSKLVAELKRLNRLQSVSGLLGWDEQVNLPANSAQLRAEQSSALAEVIHQEATRSEQGEWLHVLETNTDALDQGQRRVVEEARRNYDEGVKIPAEFVKRKATADSQSYHAWTKARAEDNFRSFEPFLKEQVELAREQAALLGREHDAYDYWIDRFDPGMDQAQVDALFGPLRADLVPLVRTIVDSEVVPPSGIFKSFPEDAQERFLKEVIQQIGFDFSRGRIDRAVHPFCGGHPQDTRMTTRYDENNPLDSLSSAIHETGHGLYEQGLPEEHDGTALGEAVGMAVHESQSRIWENQVGRGRAFWQYWEKRYRDVFPRQLANVSSAQLYLAINSVAVTPIRVDADEVTYNLHIMLRYELEKQFFNGKLAIADLPSAWNQLSKDILGFAPGNNKDGCLQDVHWAVGLFGYFPSYTLGNMMAAQMWNTIRKEMPDLEAGFSQGNFTPMLEWLRRNVHAHGKLWRTNELAKRVTGGELSHKPLVAYLKERYLPLYNVA